MSRQEAIKRLAIEWWPEIDAAEHGDLKPLIQSLRSDKPFDRQHERWLRNKIASILAGEFKRSRGRPTQSPELLVPPWVRLFRRNPRLAAAVAYVDRYVRIQRIRYHRTRGVEAQAIEKAAKKYGQKYQTILNFRHRSKRPRRAKKKRT
jgi:hypothetical protein